MAQVCIFYEILLFHHHFLKKIIISVSPYQCILDKNVPIEIAIFNPRAI